ncbi:MAG: winged helix-turn-helix transcriptional regulator [Rubricoccaceae bacterium]
MSRSATSPRPALPPCPAQRVFDAVSGKWKLPLLWTLRGGALRFGAVRRAVPGISARMLAQQLRALEADGLVRRTVFAEVPPRTEYMLTERGESLVPLLNGLADWGERHLAAAPPRPGRTAR